MTPTQRRCSRCGRVIRIGYVVAGYEGVVGKRCATEICQGRIELARRIPDQSPRNWDNDDPLPF